MNIYVYHNRQLLYNGPAPCGVGMLEFVPGCVADKCGDIDLTRYEVKRIGTTLNGGVCIFVEERPVERNDEWDINSFAHDFRYDVEDPQ